MGAQCDSLAAKVHALNMQGSHVGARSKPNSPASLPASCLLSGKAVEDGPKPWDPAPSWETQKKLWAPGFGSAQFWHLQPLEQ